MHPTDGLSIRAADTDEDVDLIFLLLHREYQEFARVPLNPEKAYYEIARCVAHGAAFIVEEGGSPVDAKSILMVMALGAKCGETVTLTAEGDGADAVLDSLVELLSRDLDAE